MLLAGTEETSVALMPDGSLAMDPDGIRVDTSIDKTQIRQKASDIGMDLVELSLNEADITTLLKRIDSNLTPAEDPDAIWVDDAWWLIWPALLLMLGWFRRGWTMQW